MKPSPSDTKSFRRIVIVDAANTLYRAFFAIPPLRASDGTPTNAAYGFVNMLNKVIREEAPDAVVVVFDAPGKSFRHEVYSGYKATRDAQPEDLSSQIPLVRELIDAYRVPTLEVAGVEADDVIATLVEAAPADTRVTIVSTDKDLMQLVGDRVQLLDTMKDRRYGPKEVEERFGVGPGQLLDARALVGDTSDNIPGVKGIGEKGAAALIQRWGSLEEMLAHAEEVEPTRSRNALREQADQARLSKQLATLRRDVPLPVAFEDLRRAEPDVPRLRALFERLQFTRLLDGLGASPAAADAARAAPSQVETDLVKTRAELRAVVEPLAGAGPFAALVVGAEGGVMQEPVVGLALGLGEDRAAYVAVGPELPAADLVLELGPLLGPGGARRWIVHDAKRLHAFLGEHAAELAAPVFDVETAGSLLDPAASRGVSGLASAHLGQSLRSWEELAGRGARATAAPELPVDDLAGWAGEQVVAIAALAPLLEERLVADGLAPLFEEVETPLSAVLARMERAGVRVDEAVLAGLSQEYESQLAKLEDEIHQLAGESFLISSPKQLQGILFEKLKLPVVRKTKTGYSTDEGVLEQLASQHELPARILAYRRLAKLKSTYVDALPPLVNPRTGRIHPTFNQSGAATGRLSATNPNVQNIPIRTPEGVRIREAFVAAEGHLLVSADYSQVELRILAHYSEDPSLLEAFRNGEDVHRRTAAEVAGIPPEAVSEDQRSRAKAINFGIIYGSTAFGIANQLGIASAEAQATIDRYFERYQGVRRFLDATIEGAREAGFVRTLLGRRRYLPDLGSRNRVLRNAAERMAVNTVIQGTAADLIKRAMVQVDARLREQAPDVRMVLQVHDELVFEVPEPEVDALSALAREEMQEVWSLRVPLAVEIGVGRNWREAH